MDDLTKRQWEIVLSCADCGITDQDDQRAAIAAVEKFAAWLAAADREAPDEGQTFTASVTMGQHREGCDPTKRDRYGLVCWGCADAPPVSDEQEKP